MYKSRILLAIRDDSSVWNFKSKNPHVNFAFTFPVAESPTDTMSSLSPRCKNSASCVLSDSLIYKSWLLFSFGFVLSSFSPYIYIYYILMQTLCRREHGNRRNRWARKGRKRKQCAQFATHNNFFGLHLHVIACPSGSVSPQ